MSSDEEEQETAHRAETESEREARLANVHQERTKSALGWWIGDLLNWLFR